MKTTAKVKTDSNSITLSGVRMSFVHFDKPRGYMGSDENPQYSAALMIPKDSKEAIEAIKSLMARVLKEKWPRKEKRPAQINNPMKDGDKSDREEQEGYFVINVRSKEPIECYKGKPLAPCEASEIYSGCWAAVQLGCFAYSMGNNNGISFGINGAAFLKDDERFGASAKKDLTEALGDLWDSEEGEEDTEALADLDENLLD